jgi:hypothetical protein
VAAGEGNSIAEIAALAAREVYLRPEPGESVEAIEGFVVDRSFSCATEGSGFFATGLARRGDGWLILAVCGSDEPVDLAACVNLALCQYRPNRDVLLDYLCDPAWRHVTLTGHSLGGAICQYLAYDLIRRRSDLEGRLDLWTFNGLGGLIGLQRLHCRVGDEVRRIRAVHFAHPADVVPRIGGNIGGELRLLKPPAGAPADSHGLAHFLPAAGRSPLADCTVSPDRPFRIAATAECLGPRLRRAALDWIAGRRLRAATRLLMMLPAVPRAERREVLRLLLAMSALPFSYRRAMRGTAERLRQARVARAARRRALSAYRQPNRLVSIVPISDGD